MMAAHNLEGATVGLNVRRTVVVTLIAAIGAGAVLLAVVFSTSRASSGNLGSAASAPRPPRIRGLQGALGDRPDPVTHLAPGTRLSTASTPIGAWKPLGPAPTGPPFLASGGFYGGISSGRVTSLAVLPGGSFPGRVIIGAAGGGIWTTDNGGTTWTARTDKAADLAIGSLAVDPSNANHVIAGTGEGNNSGDSYPGDGVLDSTNAGGSWTLQNPGGVFSGTHIEQVAISSSGTEFAATDAGLYILPRGGSVWAKPTDPSYTQFDGQVTAVVVNPSNPSIVYIADASGAVAKSADGGSTWAAADSGIAVGGGFLTALAIAPSNPSTMYASVGGTSAVKLFMSTTGGSSWSQLTNAPDFTGQAYSYGSGSSEQGWYDNVLAVDPGNASHLVAGGITAVDTTSPTTPSWTNINGGPFFANSGPNKIHPDQHALAFAPDGTVWIGDDGGVSHYTPSSGAVANANGQLNITQFYYGFNVAANTLLAGSQDNASARTNSTSQTAWTGIFGGDGGPSAITANDTPIQFIEANGNLYITTDGFSSTLTRITPPQLGLFTPPMIVVPNTATPSAPTVYYGGPNLYRTTNPTASPPTWTQVTTHGSSTCGSVCVSAIAASADGQDVYVGFTDGVIDVSTNSGLTFTAVATSPSPEQFVTGISVDPTNPQAITASFSFNDTRYRNGLPHVLQYNWTGTTAAGGTWSTITGNLPAAAVSHVIYDNGALLAATDAGAYATGAVSGSSTAWTKIGTALPSVQVQDLFLGTNGLYAVTHGRGAWWLPPPADLSVLVAAPASFPKGGTGTYTVTVKNAGPAGASTVKLTDAVPSGTTFVSESQSSGPGFTCHNPASSGTGTTTCSIATLASGATATFQITYSLPSSTTLTTVPDTAKVSSSVNPDPNTANNASTASAPVS